MAARGKGEEQQESTVTIQNYVLAHFKVIKNFEKKKRKQHIPCVIPYPQTCWKRCYKCLGLSGVAMSLHAKLFLKFIRTFKECRNIDE